MKIGKVQKILRKLRLTWLCELLYKHKQPLEKQSKNPYELIWYQQGWSEKKLQRNNAKYWEWEFKKQSKIY